MAADSVSTVFDKLTGKESTEWWMTVYFDGQDIKLLAQSGEQGFSSLVKSLDESKIVHGVFKVLGVDNRGNLTAVRPKFVAFTYVGSGVSALKRGQAGPQRDKLKNVFKGVALEVQFDDLSDFSAFAIAQKLLASGGAHKPTEYDFGSEKVTVEQLIGQKHT